MKFFQAPQNMKEANLFGIDFGFFYQEIHFFSKGIEV